MAYHGTCEPQAEIEGLYGPISVTRLGIKGELVRCAVSRGVLTAEKEQGRCAGMETAIGPQAYQSSPGKG